MNFSVHTQNRISAAFDARLFAAAVAVGCNDTSAYTYQMHTDLCFILQLDRSYPVQVAEVPLHSGLYQRLSRFSATASKCDLPGFLPLISEVQSRGYDGAPADEPCLTHSGIIVTNINQQRPPELKARVQMFRGNVVHARVISVQDRDAFVSAAERLGLQYVIMSHQHGISLAPDHYVALACADADAFKLYFMVRTVEHAIGLKGYPIHVQSSATQTIEWMLEGRAHAYAHWTSQNTELVRTTAQYAAKYAALMGEAPRDWEDDHEFGMFLAGVMMRRLVSILPQSRVGPMAPLDQARHHASGSAVSADTTVAGGVASTRVVSSTGTKFVSRGEARPQRANRPERVKTNSASGEWSDMSGSASEAAASAATNAARADAIIASGKASSSSSSAAASHSRFEAGD